MASVGTVSVKVSPDLSEFEPELRAAIRRIVREEIDAALSQTTDATHYEGR